MALTGDTGKMNSDHITNNPALTLSGIETGAKVEYSLDGGTTWSTSAPTAAQLVQGANTIDVRQTDVAGNVSAITPFAFTLDTVVPTIAITSPIAGDDVVNAAEAAAGFAISGTTSGVADGQTATIVIVNSSNAIVDTYTPTVTGNAWTVNVTPGQAQGLANGSYTVKADVSDQAGNAASEATQSLTVSTAALSITITSPLLPATMLSTRWRRRPGSSSTAPPPGLPTDRPRRLPSSTAPTRCCSASTPLSPAMPGR